MQGLQLPRLGAKVSPCAVPGERAAQSCAGEEHSMLRHAGPRAAVCTQPWVNSRLQAHRS